MKNEDKIQAAKSYYGVVMDLIEKVNTTLKDEEQIQSINGRLGLLLNDFNLIIVKNITGKDEGK